MRKLDVKNFSVIKDAELVFSEINVIIGPQASGKSLLCKLAYFFLDILSTAPDALVEEVTLSSFKQQVKESFLAWFPVNTWGKGKFQIDYQQDNFSVSVVRTSYSGSVGEKIRLTICSDFCDAYEASLAEIRSLIEHQRAEKNEEVFPPWRVNEVARNRIRSVLGKGQSEYQTYIPAGRAFFTTYSKAMAVFESGALDPVTSRFGRMIDYLLNDRIYFPETKKNSFKAFDEIQSRILKGKLVRKKGKVQFETDDGRNLALAHLSSGTLEALPLLSSLRVALNGQPGRTVYSEEPEVHLFPSAQLELVKLFAWLANEHTHRSCWIITTHSPYILSSFNNLIEAGQVGATKNRGVREKVSAIIPEHFWIKKGDFTAYSISEGRMESILNESGLIEGNYLDQVSEVIGSEFDSLLRIEYDHSKAS